MKTANQLYGLSDNSNVMYGVYNDECPPDSTASSTYAHAKGILMTDSKQGFWLVHSKPHWPNARKDGPAPFPDMIYGQSFMCITLTPTQVYAIASNLMISRPYICDKLASPTLAASFPNFNNWLALKYTTTITSTSGKIQSYAGAQYHTFAKSKAWGKDLWDDLVAPYFNTAIDVETWRSGSGGRMGSICGDGVKKTNYDVIEVSTMALPDGVVWKGTQDHSKWAAALKGSQKLSSGVSTNSTMVCVGDNNRMCSQEARGGGALCLENYDMWLAFTQTIVTVEGCYDYNPCDGSSTHCYWCPAQAYSSPESQSMVTME